jgi:hypothetical protein
MTTTSNIGQAEDEHLDAQAQVRRWEQAFRADFERDGGLQFEPLLQRFGIGTGAREMLEGTVDFVTACAAMASINGIEIGPLLADLCCDPSASNATYALTFDLFGRSAARLLVGPEMKSIDLADLYEFPWDRLRWATGTSGSPASMARIWTWTRSRRWTG